MRKILFVFLAAAVTITLHAGDTAPSATMSSGDNQISLVELYSSEGCSSCPRAEEWLSGLQTSKGLWKNFIPVSFHVDYWDYLGWKDKWASHEFTRRQKSYASLLNSDSIYTPEFIVNGLEWKRGFSSGRDFPSSGFKVGAMTVNVVPPLAFHVAFAPIEKRTRTWRAEAVVLGMDVMSHVTAGENEGRTLRHDFIVLSHGSQTLKKDTAGFSGTLTLPVPALVAPRYAVAVWISADDSPAPIQAVGGDILDSLVR